jgi:hypothetical protein
MAEFIFKLFVSVGITAAIKAGVAIFGGSIAWWLAALIALVVVFGGWLLIVDSDGAWD